MTASVSSQPSAPRPGWTLRRALRVFVLSVLVGVLAGLSSAAFLLALDRATDERFDHPWLLFLLPLGGLAVGLVYHYGGGRSSEGNNLILDEIHEPTAWVPRQMAPMVFVGTVVTQLFGGSAGREGAAIQMSGSLSDAMSRVLRIDADDRRILLVAAMGAGFGAVFGVPFAGAVFGLEVQRHVRRHLVAVLPCLVASLVGDRVVRSLGVHHGATPDLSSVPYSLSIGVKVVLVGVVFGLTATVFTFLTHGIKSLMARGIPWPPARPLVGGVVVIVVTLLYGTRIYNGLSVELIAASLYGGHVPTWGFAAKLLLTAITLGAGFVGGEVTPLFVIGATLGATLAGVLDLPVPLIAAIGFVAVFGGAAHTPAACAVMGLELFGPVALPYVVLACVVAHLLAADRGVYGSKRGDLTVAHVPWIVLEIRHRQLGIRRSSAV